MGKAIELTDDLLDAPPPVPLAARSMSPKQQATKPAEGKGRTVEPIATIPLQLRLPADEVRAIKMATISGEYDTISAYILAAVHAFKPTVK